MKVLKDWFLWGMGLVVLLAWLLPEPGADGGFLQPDLLNKVCVAFLFFLHGACLPFEALRAGALNWRLHVLIQLTTFLVFPLMGLAGLAATPQGSPAELRVGFFYLCALPSTVSSSVAMTASARGNVPVAVFNATLSSLIGIVLTPLWMSLFTTANGASFPFGKVMLDLCLWLLLPLVVGQLSRPILGGVLARHKPIVNIVDRLTILLMVYTSFCDSFMEGTWTHHGLHIVLLAAGGTLALFLLVVTFTWRICTLCSIAPPDRAAVVFCGSKKTLASGVPMARLIFTGDPNVSLILLPLMIYHPLQLFLCGILASRWNREALRREA